MNLNHGGEIFSIARERGWDWREIADFSASVNPLGPSPAVADAIRASVDRIAHYPERDSARLRVALAELWSADPDQILLGNGATELIYFLARVERLKGIACPFPVFSEFHRAFSGADDGAIILTNPVNPTGESIDIDAHLAGDRMVIVDESFIDFTAMRSSARLVESRRNLFVLRSLTKFYALPGLRIGALIASRETIARWRRQREPWQVNVLAEAAAIAAISDGAHARRTRAFVREQRDTMMDRLSHLRGVHPRPSIANYIYCSLEYRAAPLCAYLADRKILIRNCAGWPGIDGEGVRIAVRPEDECNRLFQAWKEFSCES